MIDRLGGLLDGDGGRRRGGRDGSGGGRRSCGCYLIVGVELGDEGIGEDDLILRKGQNVIVDAEDVLTGEGVGGEADGRREGEKALHDAIREVRWEDGRMVTRVRLDFGEKQWWVV